MNSNLSLIECCLLTKEEIVMASFGYGAKEPYPKTRQSLEKVVQWI
ncbi:hypothetical protein [Clostridium pasteurianum]|nr:hypothetical protein [Clostridium pasteurianum]